MDGVSLWDVMALKLIEHVLLSNLLNKTHQIQNLNVSHLVSQLSLRNLLKPGVKLMKMYLDRRCSNYIWVINNLIAC